MVTMRDVITQAQKDCGVLGLGQTMNAEDTNDAQIRFQNMIGQWQMKRWLQPSLFDIAMPGNDEKSNQIGNGQYWNTPRPDKIRAAYFIQLNGSSGSQQVSFPLWPINSYEEYAKLTLKELNSFPVRFFYDQAYPYGNVFIWPIPSASYEIHLIIPSQLGFSTTINDGEIVTAGSGYTNGVYAAVPLINLASSQNGLSATANVTVAGGVVTAFAIQNGGELYKVNETVTLDTGIVGAGTGFIWKITSTESNLDSEMSFPPEYQEALIYNLSLRLSAMYQLQATAETKMLARTSLKTIIAANTMIPVLGMPRLLPRTSRGGRTGIVNYNGGVVWADVG